VEYKKAPDLEGARSGAAPGWISRWSASLYSLPGVFAGAMENRATELMRAALRQTCRASRMRRPLTRSTPDQGPPGGAHLCRIGSMKMVEAITGHELYVRFRSRSREQFHRHLPGAFARMAAALLPIRSACFSRLSARSVCHRAVSRWRIPFRRITPSRHSRNPNFQEPVNLLKLCET
jgi:hypothetical protein